MDAWPQKHVLAAKCRPAGMHHHPPAKDQDHQQVHEKPQLVHTPHHNAPPPLSTADQTPHPNTNVQPTPSHHESPPHSHLPQHNQAAPPPPPPLPEHVT